MKSARILCLGTVLLGAISCGKDSSEDGSSASGDSAVIKDMFLVEADFAAANTEKIETKELSRQVNDLSELYLNKPAETIAAEQAVLIAMTKKAEILNRKIHQLNQKWVRSMFRNL